MMKFSGCGVFRCKDNVFLVCGTKNMLQKKKIMLQRAFKLVFCAKDAAFVLNYLLAQNNIHGLDKNQLKDLAINIGSDIPFFLSNYQTAHVSGYGDEVKKIKNIRVFYKIYPIMVKCETQKVYNALDKDKNYDSKYSAKSLIVDVLTENFNFVDYYNDLQKYVFEIYPEIKKHFDNLNKFKKNKIIVNGSGSYLIIFNLY